MCVLPPGTKLSEKEFEHCWDNNPDGGGYVFINDNNEFVINKSLNYDEFRKSFKESHDRFGADRKFLVHFRVGTSGGKTLENTHPFIVNKDTVMAHNGMLGNVQLVKDSGKSDTRTFVEDELATLPINFLRNKAIRRFIQHYIGNGNKLAFLTKATPKGSICIFNYEDGVVSDGRWFSNESFKWFRQPSQYFQPNKVIKDIKPATINTPERKGESFPIKPTPSNLDKVDKCDYCKSWDIVSTSIYMSKKVCPLCELLYEQIRKKSNLYPYSAWQLLEKIQTAHASSLVHR